MDGFINDITTITIEDLCWVERTKNTALLVIHNIFRPLNSNKYLKLDDPLPLLKLAGGGQIYKIKTCLGWDIQTCSQQVLLPR